jgi:hypothetical protein
MKHPNLAAVPFECECEINTYRAGGYVEVTVTHIPTGLRWMEGAVGRSEHQMKADGLEGLRVAVERGEYCCP